MKTDLSATTAARSRTVVVLKGRRYAQASTEDIERLRDLNLARLLTRIDGEWFIDDGPVGTPAIGDAR